MHITTLNKIIALLSLNLPCIPVSKLLALGHMRDGASCHSRYRPSYPAADTDHLTPTHLARTLLAPRWGTLQYRKDTDDVLSREH